MSAKQQQDHKLIKANPHCRQLLSPGLIHLANHVENGGLADMTTLVRTPSRLERMKYIKRKISDRSSLP